MDTTAATTAAPFGTFEFNIPYKGGRLYVNDLPLTAEQAAQMQNTAMALTRPQPKTPWYATDDAISAYWSLGTLAASAAIWTGGAYLFRRALTTKAERKLTKAVSTPPAQTPVAPNVTPMHIPQRPATATVVS